MHFFDDDSLWLQDKKSLGTEEHPAISETYLEKIRRINKNYLLPAFGKKRINSITLADVKQFRLKLLNEKKLGGKTINGIVTVLNTIFQTALSENKIRANPLANLKPLMNNPEVREAFTLEDTKTILHEKGANPTSQLFNFVAAMTGMR